MTDRGKYLNLQGHGALAWNLVILVYNAAGALVLFLYGQYLFFTYPE
jgi:hypothetical protein